MGRPGLPITNGCLIPDEPITGTVHQSTTRKAVLASERGQAGQRAYRLSTVGVTVNAIADAQEAGLVVA